MPAQTGYISNYVTAAENALFSSTFTDPTLGWRAYYDEATAINFYLVNDIMGNVDGGDFYSSVYLYKAPDNPFLYMGPVWDFDISSGNVNYKSISNPTVPWMQTNAIWYAQWFKDPGFKADVIKQFNALKANGILSNWLASVSTQAAALQQGQMNNFSRWPMLGILVWPNIEAADTYSDEVSYMTNYLNLRIAYLDSTFNGKLATTSILTLPTATVYANAPATFSAHVTRGKSPTGNVTFLSSGVVLGTAGLDSNGMAMLTTDALQAGTKTIQAVYTGDTTNALAASATGQLLVLPPIVSTVTSLASSTSTAKVGATVTLSASVISNTGSTPPTGSVTFAANGKSLGTAALSGGAASLTTTSLVTGNNAIQATYAGNTSFEASSSDTVSVAVSGQTVQINVSASVTGASFSVDGVVYTSSQTFSLAPGSVHTLSTTSPQSTATTQSTFVSWSDGGAQTHNFTVPSTATSYQANFSNKFLLTTNVLPGASGSIQASPAAAGGFYPAGTVVTLTANPAAGYSFANWIGSVADSTSVTTTVTLSAPQAVTANFSASSSSGSINLGNGFPAGSVVLNGSSSLSGTRLRLVNGSTNERSSAFYGSAVNVQSFTTDFSFELPAPLADGFTFVLQNQGVNALGGLGINLGYGSGTTGISKSVAIKFDLYNNRGEGTNSTGIYLNGASPTTPATDLTPSGVNLRSGNPFNVHMTYNGTTLVVTITDTVTAATATQTYTVNIPSVVGGSTAFAGFTAGTGALASTEDILGWTMSPASSGSINLGNGFPAGSVVLNGSSSLSGTRLRLVNGSTNERSSAFYGSAVNVQSFTTDFSFELPAPLADGFTFVLQNQGVNALGGLGINLGYGSGTTGISKSVAIKFDLYNNRGEGTNSTGIYLNGASPTTPATDLTPSGVNLRSGNPFNVHMTYNGTTLVVTITDTVTAATATQTYTVNIPSVVGGSTAFAGFTAGTGALASTEDILGWTM